jgi:hypothetical protein
MTTLDHVENSLRLHRQHKNGGLEVAMVLLQNDDFARHMMARRNKHRDNSHNNGTFLTHRVVVPGLSNAEQTVLVQLLRLFVCGKLMIDDDFGEDTVLTVETISTVDPCMPEFLTPLTLVLRRWRVELVCMPSVADCAQFSRLTAFRDNALSTGKACDDRLMDMSAYW